MTAILLCKRLEQLTVTLKQESESAVEWFSNNEILGNPRKFKAIILSNESKK